MTSRYGRPSDDIREQFCRQVAIQTGRLLTTTDTDALLFDAGHQIGVQAWWPNLNRRYAVRLPLPWQWALTDECARSVAQDAAEKLQEWYDKQVDPPMVKTPWGLVYA